MENQNLPVLQPELPGALAVPAVPEEPLQSLLTDSPFPGPGPAPVPAPDREAVNLILQRKSKALSRMPF